MYNETLKVLNLRGNHISGVGLQGFIMAINENLNLQMQSLDLSSNRINDPDGVDLIRALRKLQPLESLSLRDNNLSKESGDELLFLCKEKMNMKRVHCDMNMIKYITGVEIDKTCKRNRAVV